MSPQTVQLILDLTVVFMTIYIIFQVIHASIGGIIGSAFQFILVGLVMIAISYLLDTAYVGEFLKLQTFMPDFLQSALVLRGINLIAFSFITFGFSKLSSVTK